MGSASSKRACVSASGDDRNMYGVRWTARKMWCPDFLDSSTLNMFNIRVAAREKWGSHKIEADYPSICSLRSRAPQPLVIPTHVRGVLL